MILADTSVWVDHLRKYDETFAALLDAGTVLAHAFVIGEIALGYLQQREIVLDALSSLPQAGVATDKEALFFIDRHALFGRGIGYVDAHLLAAVQLMPGTELWTRDRWLREVAVQLGLSPAVLQLPRP